MTTRSALTDRESPHLLATANTRKIMAQVLIALLPAVAASIYYFGWYGALLYLIAIFSAQLAEIVWFKLKGQALRFDLSAVVTAVLLTMNLPPSAPWYFPLIGCSFAIIVVKEFFGGLGYNFLNPALAGRALLVALFFDTMFKISWPDPPFAKIDPEVVTQATPLAAMQSGQTPDLTALWQSFTGNIGGRLGETSSLLLLLGGLYLIKCQVIKAHIPLIICATVALGAWLWGEPTGLASWQTVCGQLLGGGLLLGAIFMATDYASSPATRVGECLYAFLIGCLILLFRFHGATNEGVSYAILIMNCATPLIDQLLRRRVHGEPGKTGNMKIDW